MSGPEPSYFVPSNFDTPFPGPIALGQIISNVKDPRSPIDSTGPESFIQNHIEPFSNSHSVVVHEDVETKKVEGGLFFRALQGVALRAGARFEANDYRTILSHIDRLDYTAIAPTDDYVHKSMKREAVQKWLRRHWFRNIFKDIYMITGLKVAYPAMDGDTSISVKQETATRSQANIEAAGDAAGVAAAAGGKASRNIATQKSYSFVPTRPFIYAFELRTCHHGAETSTSERMVRGALLSAGSQSTSSSTPSEGNITDHPTFVWYGLDEHALAMAALGRDAQDFDSQLTFDEIDGAKVSLY